MVRCILLIAVLISAAAHAAAPPAPRVMGRSWMVGDLTRDQVLVAEKADERIEPASLTKLMTAYLVFAALRDRKLTLEQPVAVSTRAARDLYALAAAVIRDFPEDYARYYAIKEYRYNNITQPNRNRLLWLDPTVDGVKTGHTEAAGYCLIASSKRGPRRLLSVLLGSTSESARTQESQKLLNWGYQFFDSVKLYGNGEVVRTLEVWKGAANGVKAGSKGDLYVTVPKGEAPKLKAELVSQRPLIAPIAQGQQVGTLRVALDGKPFAEYPLIALETVGPAGIFGRAWDTLRLWIK